MMSNLDVSQFIVEELMRLGVTQFVISPGSRSTPLTVAIARHPEAKTTVHFDERGCAFYALGYARATGAPAVLVCTSGTAVANYFPAIIEASMDNVPLIVLSADRPPELIGVGANQAIFQKDIYGVYPRLALNLAPPDSDTSGRDILDLIDRLYDASTGTRPGPVHLNCQFREPLLPGTKETVGKTTQETSDLTDRERLTLRSETPLPVLTEQLQIVPKALAEMPQGLIVVGRSVSSKNNEAILNLATALGWPILADVQSKLRFTEHPHIINHFDLGLLTQNLQGMPPEMVIHLGGAFTSKRLLKYLDNPDIYYISVKETSETIDPNHQVNLDLTMGMEVFCHSLLNSTYKNNPHWLEAWQKVQKVTFDKVLATLDGEKQLSEPGISYWLSKMIPDNHSLMLANSMPIREMEMFASAGHFRGEIFANRGSSGIDGLLATSAGYGAGSNAPVTVLIGDLAFLHDLNSLQLIKTGKQPIIMIAINNDGGGIFSFLPIQNETDVFEPFFGTPHGLTLEHAASLFGLPYSKPIDITEFQSVYSSASQSGESILIEIVTDRAENHRFHQLIFEKLRESR